MTTLEPPIGKEPSSSIVRGERALAALKAWWDSDQPCRAWCAIAKEAPISLPEGGLGQPDVCQRRGEECWIERECLALFGDPS